MRGSSSSASTLGPPMYWNVPGSEKGGRNYISENMKQVREVSSQVKKSKIKEKLEPMKVKFIPGLTKNPKYEHVESKISGLIRGPMRVPADREKSNSLLNSSTKAEEKISFDEFKPIWGASAMYNARRIKSNTDVRKTVSSTTPVFRRKVAALKPSEESVYNWRFSDLDNGSQSASPGFVEQERESNPEKFTKFKDTNDIHFHRVEYLPCDGICADEAVVVNGNGDTGSGSGRSSRGINTQETRIFNPVRPAQSLTNINQHAHNNGYGDGSNNGFVESRSISTACEPHELVPQEQRQFIQTHGRNLQNGGINGGGGDLYKENSVDPLVSRIEKNLSSMKLNRFQTQENSNNAQNQRIQAPFASNGTSGSTLTIGSSYPSNESSGILTHRAGVVPKYLKKRQQQWKEEEVARKEAERAAKIPEGHVEMSETERLETFAQLQQTYNSLVNELNRVPIRIDTIRVRDYKQNLEKELTKLEEAMKIFSRPQVFVKIDQQ